MTDAQVAALGSVTITVWDNETTGGPNTVIEAQNKAFMAKYPNVTIDRVSMAFQDLQAKLKLGMSGPNPPDVAETNVGFSMLGPLVQAGLVKPLDTYAAAYSWDQRYSPTMLKQGSFGSNGKAWGTGSLYGISLTQDFVGVYYNKAKLQALGLQVPKTLADFEAALKVAKNAGQIPIMLGTLTKNPVNHLVEIWWNVDVPADFNAAWNYHIGDPSYCNDGTIKAATSVQQLGKEGYFTPGWAGTNWVDTVKAFTTGTGVFYPTGTWWAGDMAKGLGDGVGYFVPETPDGKTIATGAGAQPWAISTGSKHLDLAAKYLDFLTGGDAAKLIIDNSAVPAMNTSIVPSDPQSLVADVLAQSAKIAKDNGLYPYPDGATPSLMTPMSDVTIELLSGKVTPQQYCQAVQTEYMKYHDQVKQ